MPIYTRRCVQCSHQFDEYSKVDDRDKIKCDVCGSATDGVPALTRAERRFSGQESESMTRFFGETELDEARRLYPDHQHCIRDDGSVWFATRSEEKSYAKREKELQQIAESRRKEREDEAKSLPADA